MEKEKEQAAVEDNEEIEEEAVEDDSRFDKIYSNVASNRYENLRTSHIENKAKELSKKRK